MKRLLKVFFIFRGNARQRGRGFGALARTHGRTAISFIKKTYSPSSKKNRSRFISKLLLQRLEKLSVDKKTQNV